MNEMATEAPYPYEGPPALRAPIEAALRQVVDPEIALSVVDAGLVLGVLVVDRCVHVRMTLTSAACPVADMILADVEAELAAVLPPGHAVQAELVWEPPWTADRLSARAKAFMGW